MIKPITPKPASIKPVIRLTDPQRLATNPGRSLMASASAGTGKTHVLTARVLRLLLTYESLDPRKILCLTYTRAAAKEMTERIHQTLARWARADEQTLRADLKELTDDPEHAMTRARGLILTILSKPIRIETFHAYCQFILRCFPGEADLPPTFQVIDDAQKKHLYERAYVRVFARPSKTLGQALDTLTQHHSFAQLDTLLEKTPAREKPPRCADFGTTKAPTPEHIWQEIGNHPDLSQAAQYLRKSGKTSFVTRGEALAACLKHPDDHDAYIDIFLTQQKKIRTRLSPTKTPEPLADALIAEAERLRTILTRHAAATAYHASVALHTVKAQLEIAYRKEKHRAGVLDYDDLIERTRHLLQNPGRDWVLYRLDGGIEHLLVDEAQDTNAAQWEILDLLTEEIRAGFDHHSQTRTTFHVGDGKQSIYSFQGAAPELFQNRLTDTVTIADSFRSAPAILTFVDQVCEKMRLPCPTHLSRRREKVGRVELWPLVTNAEGEDAPQPDDTLASTIAQTIRGWIDHKTLPGKKGGLRDRRVRPGDIMILLQKRHRLAPQLIHALHAQNIPVVGKDRMIVSQEPAVKDILALLRVWLLPQDSLNLAIALKTPIIDMDEDALMTLASERETNLWEALGQSPHQDIVNYLHGLRFFKTPYLAVMNWLAQPCPGHTTSVLAALTAHFGSSCHEAIDAFVQRLMVHQGDLQTFVETLARDKTSLRLDYTPTDAVQIMTVHGAKGLQAPIVILPDTMYHKGRDIGHIVDGCWLPTKKECDTSTMRAQRDRADEKALKEYHRLAYVAMTRAEDCLYIAGYHHRKSDKVDEKSWYAHMAAALAPLASTEKRLDSQGHAMDVQVLVDLPPAGERIKAPERVVVPAPRPPLPDFLRRPPPPPQTPRPISPSKTAAGLSPLVLRESRALGSALHRMIAYAHAHPASERRARLEHLSQDTQVIDHTLEILERFPELSEGQSEVPLAATVELGGQPTRIYGIIDCLIQTDTQMKIIDFKRQKLPATLADIPANYVRQMALYQLAARHIRPDLPIECGLLWTQGLPTYQSIPDEILYESLQEITKG